MRISAGRRFLRLPLNNFNLNVADENYILERKWVDFGVRYGDKALVAEEVLKEVDALYPQDRLEQNCRNEQSNRSNSCTRA